jgi:hypothetical protein
MAVTCDHECATSSTSAGDGIHDAESLSSLEINLSSEMTVQNGGEDDIYSPAPIVDRSEMPNTREPSPEPLYYAHQYKLQSEEYYSGEIQADGPAVPCFETPQRFLAQGSLAALASQRLAAHMQQAGDLYGSDHDEHVQATWRGPPPPLPSLPLPAPAAMLPMGSRFMYLPVSVPVTTMPMHLPQGKSTPGNYFALPQQPNPQHVPSSTRTEPAPEPKERKAVPVAQSASTGKAKREEATNAKSDGHLSVGHFDTMSADQKKAICKYIYDIMIQKEMIDPEGYLVADVFHEVWTVIGSNDGTGRRTAASRFWNLLRSAPQHFRLFRKKLQVAPRGGERMVRLVLEKKDGAC